MNDRLKIIHAFLSFLVVD